MQLNAEVHAISCGSKPLSTWYAFRAIQESRLCAGGHGFSSVSGLTALRDYHDPFQTFEGDNNVLLQQLERYLLKTLQKRAFDSPLQSVAFLHKASDETGKCAWDGTGPLNVREALETRVCYQLRNAAQTLSEEVAAYDKSRHGPFKDYMWSVWNAAQPGDLQGAAKAFIECLVFSKSAEAVRQSQFPVLEQLSELFGLQLLLGDDVLLESGYFSASQNRLAKRRMVHLSRTLASDAKYLVDVFAPPDALINSALAHGNYCDNLWAATKRRTERVDYWQSARTPVEPMSRGNLVARVRSKL